MDHILQTLRFVLFHFQKLKRRLKTTKCLFQSDTSTALDVTFLGVLARQNDGLYQPTMFVCWARGGKLKSQLPRSFREASANSPVQSRNFRWV